MSKSLTLTLVLFLFAICLIINSCKNDSNFNPSKSNGNPNNSVLSNYGTVSAHDLLTWFKQNPQYTPAGVLLGQAQQQVINNQPVVRIPIATNAALYFTKVNGTLTVYAYKWIYTAPATSPYNGTIDIYNFQTQDFKRQIYTNGKITKVLLLSSGVAAKAVSSTNTKQQVNSIGTILGQIWCWLTGGTWVTLDSNSGNYGAQGDINLIGCNYDGNDDTDDPNPFPSITIYIDDSGDVYNSAPDGGGGSWGPPPCPSGGDGTNSTKTKQINAIAKKQIDVAAPPDDGGSGCPTAPDGSQWTPYSITAYNLSTIQQQWLYNNLGYFEALDDFINSNPDMSDQDAANFLSYSIDYLTANSSISVPAFLNQITLVEDPTTTDWTTEPDNQVLTDPDPTLPAEYQQSSPWPTISYVIPFAQFVPMRLNPNGTPVNCLTLSKEQIGKAGYTVSGYLPGSQTFSIYTTANGVNISQTKQAITYVISALTNHIPVLAGVDAYPGSVNLDGTTDHFITIDAMGTDADGKKYFHFIDNSTGRIELGNSANNKLYYNETTGLISGKTASPYPYNEPNSHDYILSQIRKSIKL